MTRHLVDARELIGRHLTSAIVGWHIHGASRTEELLYLRGDRDLYEVCTIGDGSLQLDGPKVAPQDFDMDAYGSFALEPVDHGHVLHPLLGSTIHRVRLLRRDQTTIGWRLETDAGPVILANLGDDIFLSTGALPPDPPGITESD
ncbi:hypothetical protein BH24ACT4_BH24ACT4_15980 [soil metagenome]